MPAAGSTLGTAIGAKAAPDGYTLGMPGSGSMAVGPAMYKSLPYDPTKDFAPMALIGRVPFVLIVHPSVPVKTVPDLIAYAKTNKLFYASGGAGSPHHLYAELFKSMTGIEMTHVPYKGSADAIKDVVAGHVPADVLRSCALGAADSRRPGAGDRRDHVERAGRSRRISRRSTRPACRASTPRDGS